MILRANQVHRKLTIRTMILRANQVHMKLTIRTMTSRANQVHMKLTISRGENLKAKKIQNAERT
jgi:hypothetical protein